MGKPVGTLLLRGMEGLGGAKIYSGTGIVLLKSRAILP